MKTEIEKILIEMILNAECHFCDYKYDCEGCNKLSKFTPNSYIRTAIKELEKLLQPKEPTYLDVEQFYEDEPTNKESLTVEISAPLFEFDGYICNANQIKFITKINVFDYAVPAYRFGFDAYIVSHDTPDYSSRHSTFEEATDKRSEFIQLWNQNLTRVK